MNGTETPQNNVHILSDLIAAETLLLDSGFGRGGSGAGDASFCSVSIRGSGGASSASDERTSSSATSSERAMDCSNEGVALGEFSAVVPLAAAFACFRLSVRACFCSFLSCDFDNLGGSVLLAHNRSIYI